MKAARSASETQLRSKATSYAAKKPKGRGVVRAVTLARVAHVINESKKTADKKGNEPIYVESESKTRDSAPKSSPKTPNQPSSPKQGPQFVRSERVQKTPRQVGRGKGPAALPAPKSSPKPKAPKGPKKEKTPGMQRVFKATPAVELREGPDFGKTTNIIEPTFQPKTPKKKKNA